MIRGGQLSLEGGFRLDDVVFVTEEKADRHIGNLAFPGDVIVTQRGTLGQVGLVPLDCKYPRLLLSQSQMKITVDSKRADPSFLCYALLEPGNRQRLIDHAISAGVPHINLATLRQFRLKMPSLGVQYASAAVLRTLDDLIENNLRRIALLEETAQAIYREWFVHFRYPGHEEDELVDSPLGPIPAGWRAARLGDVIELHYGKALKASARKGGPVAVVGSSGVVGWHDQSLVSGPVVVVGRKGNVGSATWIQGESWPIDTTYYVTTDLPLRFAYRMLGEIEFIDSHAAVPGLSRDQAYSIEVLHPSLQLAGLFDETALELNAMSSVLKGQATVLSMVRDALLPKLVTGAIDVSKLDLDPLVEESAA
ncbi:MAG: restriction endonuclease subunit S [Actinomycetota bacterium]|nr:restriction endonuclease subunit S [Actinomycetota bacterium]